MNARYYPHFHVKVHFFPRQLKKAILFIGTGGTVHNLYQNKWAPILKHRDSFGFSTPPGKWALDFGSELSDAFMGAGSEKEGRICGPGLKRQATALMKLPGYTESHGTDDHFISTPFVAGLCESWEDEGIKGELGAWIGI
jgi:hypothetical protein